jgi:putative flippase GtrA
VPVLPQKVVDLARSHHGRRALKYSMVSAIAIAVSQAILISTLVLLEWDAVVSNVVAVAVSSVPSYLLNRAWVWGRKGNHNFLREVLPFWVFAFIGLGVSSFFVWGATKWSDAALVVSVANLSGFGILWVGRYILLDQLLFRALDHVHEEDEPALLA